MLVEESTNGFLLIMNMKLFCVLIRSYEVYNTIIQDQLIGAPLIDFGT